MCMTFCSLIFDFVGFLFFFILFKVLVFFFYPPEASLWGCVCSYKAQTRFSSKTTSKPLSGKFHPVNFSHDLYLAYSGGFKGHKTLETIILEKNALCIICYALNKWLYSQQYLENYFYSLIVSLTLQWLEVCKHFFTNTKPTT